MSAGIIAASVVGSAVIGGVASNMAANKQAKAISSAANQQAAADAEARALLQEQSAAWEDMYGSIEDNLAKSIDRISARSYEVRGHTELEKQYSDVTRRLDENLAARGIQGGISSGAHRQLLSDLASQKATVSSESEMKALQDKTNLFLSLGLNQKPNAGAEAQAVSLAGANQAAYTNQLGTVSANNINTMGSNVASAIGGIGGVAGGMSSAGGAMGSTVNQGMINNPSSAIGIGYQPMGNNLPVNYGSGIDFTLGGKY